MNNQKRIVSQLDLKTVVSIAGLADSEDLSEVLFISRF